MNKTYYNLTFLKNYCLENNINLFQDYDNIKINRCTKICGKCTFQDCNNVFNKTFLYMIKYGSFCEKCTKLNSKLKYKTTCLEKYGVENIFQSDKIKEDIKSIVATPNKNMNHSTRSKKK